MKATRNLRKRTPAALQASTSKAAIEDTPTPSSAGSEPASPYLPKPKTPRKRANTTISVPTKQKENLRAIDQRCLITWESGPQISVQACRIIRRKTANANVAKYQLMWDVNEINIDSTANLVLLRADWHAAYDGDCWAFVPSLEVLKRIEQFTRESKAKFTMPYKGYKKTTKYVFVAFPTLDRKFITRAHADLEACNMYFSHDGFDGFPTLTHHAHPYFVIINALPKFKKHLSRLTPDQINLYATMQVIYALWEDHYSARKSLPQPSSSKRRRDDSSDEDGDGDEGDEDGDGGNPKGKKAPRGGRSESKQKKAPQGGSPAKTKEKGKAKATETAAKISCLPLPSPPSSALLQFTNTDHDAGFYYDVKTNVLAWINAVIAAGPQEKVREDAIEPDGEVVQPPFKGDWHDWCYPYTQPSDPSRFSSNDWAMKHCMCKLTLGVGCWEVSDEDDASDGELDVLGSDPEVSVGVSYVS